MGRPTLEVIAGGRSSGRAWLKQLYARYGAAVFHRCRYLLKDPTAAEDAMQDVFAKAMVNEASFRGEASPMTWLLRIATNHCLNVLRERRAAWHDQYEAMEQVKGSSAGGAGSLEARDLVRRTLARFDVETQAAVVHYWVDDLTLEEVAQVLGRSVPTIRKRLNAFTAATGQAMRAEDGGAT
ncbi:MAG: sigma-70 family RNA polymerase sigma factor [Myxococcaceae bacterium]|nr:sigma-70 family RNA polymerase sigma factor [Myxococcaceae bacterium]